MDTSGAKIWLPGISDPATLEAASTLCGTAAFRERGQDHHSRHPVMTPDMVRQLLPGRALLIRGGYSPVIVKLPMAWKNPRYLAARRRGEAIAHFTSLTQPAPSEAPTSPHVPAPRLTDDDLDVLLRPAGLTGDDDYPWEEEPG
jgi:hypothetical protein